MKIDLYTRSWNDADMLGFFFRHYDPLVDLYYIYDDGSTDGTLDILREHPKVILRHFSYTDQDSRILSTVNFFDQCWRESRATADWVILTDIDEHLWHPHLTDYLAACRAAGVTFIPALGYQMLSDTFPPSDATLCHWLTQGMPWVQMNKLSLFDPIALSATNYSPGRHEAAPRGRVLAPPCDELLLLHYKYLDQDRVQARHESSATRSRTIDRQRQYGHKYFWTREQLELDWQAVRAGLVDIAAPCLNAHDGHPAPRWWADYPRARAL